MRTNIDINDDLMQEAIEVSDVKTKKAIVELALTEYIARKRRLDLLSLRGKIHWDGDLDQMRTDPRPNEWDQ